MTTTLDLKLPLFRWTVDDYHRLAEAGILSPDTRVELLDGQIVLMSPIGSLHAACVRRIDEWLKDLFGKKVTISIQNPVTLSNFSEPEPDLAVLQRKENFYADAHPRPEEVFLLIEVADSSAEKDKQVKIPFYAEAGIRETWLVLLRERRVEQCLQPGPEGYKTIHRYHPGEVIKSEVTGPAKVDDLLI